MSVKKDIYFLSKKRSFSSFKQKTTTKEAYYTNRYHKKESSHQARRFFSIYGTRRVQSLGNALASRTFDNSKNLYTSLSSPIPNPPCGGHP